MAQVINDPGLYAGAGQLLGQGLGGALGSGLAGLLEGKMQAMQRQQQRQQFSNQIQGAGYSPQEAQLAQLFQKDPKSLLALLSGLGGGNQTPQGAYGAPQGADKEAKNLSPAQRLGQAGNNKNREAQQLRQQAIINAENKKFNDTVSPQITNAEKLMDYIQASRQLLGTKKTAGALRSYLPFSKISQNEETQDLENIYNNIVGLMNEGQRGIPTRYKIEFNKSLKPIIGEPVKVSLKKLDRLQKEAEKVLQIGQLRDQLLAENEYKQPAGLEAKIHQLMKGEKKNPESRVGGNLGVENEAPQAFQSPTVNNNHNEAQSALENNQEGEESWPAAILRNLYRTLPTGLTSVASFPNALASKFQPEGLKLEDLEKLGVKLNPKQRAALKSQFERNEAPGANYEDILRNVQGAESKLGLPEGYSTPRPGEDLINSFQQKLPFVLKEGPLALLAALGGTLGEGAAEGLGFGPQGQQIGGLLGGIGASAALKGIRPKTIRETAKKEASKYYAPAERRAAKIKQPAKELHEFMGKEIDKLGEGKSGLTDKVSKQVRHEFTKVANDVKKNEINVLDAIKSKRHLNKLYQEHKGSEAGNYYKRGVGALNETIQKAAKDNPHFGRIWNAAEDLSKSSYIKPDSFSELFKDNSSYKSLIKNPTLLKAAVSGALKIPEVAHKSFHTFWKHPTTQRLARKILEASVKENKGQIAQLVTKLNKKADEELED